VVFLGRTNTPALSMRWFTDNALHGRTLNPWSKDHTPGGSSGGAASALAAGVGPIAHGNDLGGSIRYPAYACGVAGIRPSAGRVPAYNPSLTTERPISGQLMSAQGPLARRVRDLRLALAAMAAPDLRDPWHMPVPLALPPLPRPIRVAACIDPMGSGVDPEVKAAILQAAQWLEEAGYAVEEAAPPDFAAVTRDWDAFGHGEAQLFMKENFDRLADEDARAVYGYMVKHTRPPELREMLQLAARRATHQRAWALWQQDYPLLLCPVSTEPPFPQGLDATGQQGFDRVYAAQQPLLVSPLLGVPAASVPTGLTAQGLPMGVQLTGPRWREDLVLDAAEVIEARAALATPIDPRF
jgi:amidase